MKGIDALGALILHSKMRLAEDLDMSIHTTHCSFNVLMHAIIVLCVRRDTHTGLKLSKSGGCYLRKSICRFAAR